MVGGGGGGGEDVAWEGSGCDDTMTGGGLDRKTGRKWLTIADEFLSSSSWN